MGDEKMAARNESRECCLVTARHAYYLSLATMIRRRFRRRAVPAVLPRSK